MAESIESRLRRFQLLNNPQVSQSFLAGQPGAAAAFGAGFLAPAVDAANQQRSEIEFLRALEQDQINRRQQEARERQLTADIRNIDSQVARRQAELNEINRLLTPESIAAAEADRQLERELKQSMIDRNRSLGIGGLTAQDLSLGQGAAARQSPQQLIELAQSLGIQTQGLTREEIEQMIIESQAGQEDSNQQRSGLQGLEIELGDIGGA